MIVYSCFTVVLQCLGAKQGATKAMSWEKAVYTCFTIVIQCLGATQERDANALKLIEWVFIDVLPLFYSAQGRRNNAPRNQ